MIKNIIPNKILKYFTEGQERTIKAKKNVVASLFIKGANIAIGLFLVPIVLKYLGPTQYGIWLTLISIIGWFGFMNLGLGNGLRNRFAEEKARGNHKRARIYVSTAYAVLTIIIIGFFILFLIINFFLPWENILNVNKEVNVNLSKLAIIVTGAFCINFVANLLTVILVADQRPAIRDIIDLVGKLLILVSIIILTKISQSSLIDFAMLYLGLPVSVIILFSFYFFYRDYRMYAPSFHYINFEYGKDLLGLGWKFFLIQIALVIIMSTDNIIITQLYGPAMVTPYQIASKYFNVLLMMFTVIVIPLWSASSEALIKKDFKWIMSSVKKLKFLAILFVIISLIMLVFSKYVYSFWVGSNIKISYLLSFFWMLYVIIGIYNGIYFSIINSSGEINKQVIVYVLAMMLNIPLSIFFAKKIGMGIAGVILATDICQSLHLIYLPIQYKKIILNKIN